MKLSNIRTYFFGDSIMAQDGKKYEYPAEYNDSELGKICRGYPTLLRECFGLSEMRNFAIGGQGIKEQKEIILNQDFTEVDLVIISLGVNDFSKGMPIGSIPTSTDRHHDVTFIGEYCTAMDHIFSSNPIVKIVLMTPLHRDTLHRSGNVIKSAIDTKINGNVLKDYADAIRKIGAFYACPVADMYSNSGLNRFNLPRYTFEGVHPTNEGYEYIIGELASIIGKIYLPKVIHCRE